MNTATMPNLRLAPDTMQRAAAVLRGVGWSAADLFRLALMRTAVEGRIPFDNAAVQEAKDAKAEAALANWEDFIQEPPVDVDFRALSSPDSDTDSDEVPNEETLEAMRELEEEMDNLPSA